MTQTTLLLAPLITLLLGTAVALTFAHPAVNSRLPITRQAWLLALFPLIAFIMLVLPIPDLNEGQVFLWRVEWLPSLGLQLGFYYDSWSALFALIITFIGVLIVIYAGQYFKGDQSAWRFLVYTLLFMTSMLGLVMAGDILTLFIFWEGTSITSYLLIAYKTKDQAARTGAFRSLFITGGGGIAMLAGLLLVSSVVGSTQWTEILSSGDVLRSNEFYTVMLALVAFGAFTKSAQFPAHIWLPGAMSAPTPASAYLHSATMVKAGIYLMARLNPALGFTDQWFYLLTLAGMLTMLCGGYVGLKQNDLKGLLAYSTIAQLGVLMMLIGQEHPESYKALVIGIVAHALYKSALFLVAGIIDHETGTRDIMRLGGLHRTMPLLFSIAALAGLSMAGLPPLFGFLAKETLLAAALHPNLQPVMTAVTVLVGALMLAQAGLLVIDVFLGKPRDPAIHGHEAPKAMLLAPAIPAILSLVIAFLPGPKEEAVFLTGAAAAAFGSKVKVSLALFHGLNVPLLLSIVAITLGSIIWYFRWPVRAWQGRVAESVSFNRLYDGVMAALDKGGYVATRLQQGNLRAYLVIMMLSAVALVFFFMGWPQIPLADLTWPELDFSGELALLRLFSLLVVTGSATATVVLRRDFSAILAMTVMGLGTAVWFVLEPAPDVALVQIVVDILSLVILVLTLTKLPRAQREKAPRMTWSARPYRPLLVRDAIAALAIGVVVTVVTLNTLTSRPRSSQVTPYYAAFAKSETGATDIVGAIIVDFRALDTLMEITVFSLAGIGVFTLLGYAALKHGDHDQVGKRPPRHFKTMGIGGQLASPFLRAPAYAILPVALVIAITHMMYGHDQPGDGFTAGVVIGLAVGLWYVVFGYTETRARLRWLRASELIATGVLLAIVNGMVVTWFSGHFLGNVDYGELVGLPLPGAFHISSSFIFEIAICLAVLGSVAHMLNALGHPGEEVDGGQ
ncbi:MAG TPA: proton-conducting transporter membrane subunit [Chloroflexota bacterium]|nr:proton-conducting transporter membrane subunit [Chloroflexota bacterium]